MDYVEFFKTIFSIPQFSILFVISIIIIVTYLSLKIGNSSNKNSSQFKDPQVFADNKDIGILGENHVDSLLQRLNPSEYVVLRNLVFLNNDKTHQIDHVVVSNYGIFIIETKNYAGLIKGSDKYQKWVQFIGRKKYYFLNPIIQNKGHVKALQSYFPEYSSFFIPMVVFTDRSKLSVKSNNIVVKSSLLLSTIYNYKTEILIPDINVVAQNIKNISLDKMNGIEQDHISNVNKYR